MEAKRKLDAVSRAWFAAAVLVLCVLLALPALAVAFAKSQSGAPPRTSIIVFADHPMLPSQWPALFAALRSALVNPASEMQSLDPSPEFLRGDQVRPGIQVDSAIAVYLHGDCTLTPALHRTAFGVPLGWVRRVDGRIEPFIHVDCTHIAQVLGPQAVGLDCEARSRIMTRAIARVILHEWIHIATQSNSHSEQGIAKPQFDTPDLMGGSHLVVWRGR